MAAGSVYNRQIMADTPKELTGPARGHGLLKTAADPSGTTSLGTWNNCGNGRTPWGTYLACEENFNGYFSSSDADYMPSDELNRYGVKIEDWGYAWAIADERFDISKNPNEPNRAGYFVEIDPLGRFKHENAEVVIAANGQVVVYMGDDERGEFFYKFVSAGMGNNQMLVGDTETGEIRRFLVGPKECEVTGTTWSADRRTVFVGIQHPGEEGGSHFPDGGQSVPRSGVIAIKRDDGGLIG